MAADGIEVWFCRNALFLNIVLAGTGVTFEAKGLLLETDLTGGGS